MKRTISVFAVLLSAAAITAAALISHLISAPHRAGAGRSIFAIATVSGASQMAGNGVPTQPTTFPDIHDAGTNAVVMFYQMLLRAEPPTIADEKALLRTPSPVQRILVFARKGNENDPVVLQWLRTHKEWFVPTNMRSVGEIQISSTFRFLQSLNSEKDPRSGWGWVAAISPEAGGAKVTRIRTIIFEIYDGKVDPEGIHLDGLGGETVYTKAMEEYPSIMNGAGD